MATTTRMARPTARKRTNHIASNAGLVTPALDSIDDLPRGRPWESKRSFVTRREAACRKSLVPALTGICLCEHIQWVVETFAALAESNRFRIVELLRSGPRAVNDIGDRLHLDQTKVSKHLPRVLREVGLVDVQPPGPAADLRAAPPKAPPAARVDRPLPSRLGETIRGTRRTRGRALKKGEIQ